MLVYANTNIINNDKLRNLLTLSTEAFKSRNVYSGDLSATAFKILAYWGLYHRDAIEDKILFLEMCADKLAAEPDMFDVAVLCMNATVDNLVQAGLDYDEAPIISTWFTAANYVLDPDHVLKFAQWTSVGRVRINGGAYKLQQRISEIYKETGAVVDFKDFAVYA
tara:strand:+ start:226 stop:720 length:495 start_codon:yes stop_codon:yes gene_type:complete